MGYDAHLDKIRCPLETPRVYVESHSVHGWLQSLAGFVRPGSGLHRAHRHISNLIALDFELFGSLLLTLLFDDGLEGIFGIRQHVKGTLCVLFDDQLLLERQKSHRLDDQRVRTFGQFDREEALLVCVHTSAQLSDKDTGTIDWSSASFLIDPATKPHSFGLFFGGCLCLFGCGGWS